jgi:hypothetical protein
MHRIVATITSLEQHARAVAQQPELYRPAACSQCGLSAPWCHGHYRRKADRRTVAADESFNPVTILRFRCRDRKACGATCSRLPACIAPRRWYVWATQQLVLLCLLLGGSLAQASRAGAVSRDTARRWRNWLERRSALFIFHLCSRFHDWGRNPDTRSFWRTCLAGRALQEVMALLDRELVVP